MKTARERFFPTPPTPRAASRQASNNSDNALQRSNSGGRLRGQDSAVLSALDNLQNAGMNRPPTQMGFAALMRKSSANTLNLGSAGSITRPGTTEPRISEERGMSQNPIIAPTPKKYHQISPFALRDGPFGSDTLDFLRDGHSSKSPDNPIEERREESFKMPFPKNSNVHQLEPSQYQPRLLQGHREPSPMPTDGGDQDGLNAPSLQRTKKRMRELDEIEDSGFLERNSKRFKTHELEDDKMSRHESRSPRNDRPSSAASSAIGSYHGRTNGVTVSMPAQRVQVEGNLDLIPSNRALSSKRRSEPVGLDKLLGLGSNDLLDQYAYKYETLLKKWSECSVEEWKAGVKEISPRFTELLDFAKDHLDKKLKTYSGLNAVLDSHSEILRERGVAMDLARRKVVKQSASFLG